MKAAFLETLGSLTVREVADPQIAGPYDALCDLLYGATCSGTDMHLIEGRVRWAIDVAPSIIGHESIGRVTAIGEKVRNLKVGDLVTRVGAPAAVDGSYSSTWGGFASMGVAKDHWAMAEDGVDEGEWAGFTVNQLLPADFDPRGATMMTTWRETLSCMNRMKIPAGASVLVVGSGGVGMAFAAHAKNLGASRIVMTGNPVREQPALQAGATAHISYKADDLADQLAGAAGDGFDFVIDSVGSQASIDLALANVAVGGALAVYGINEMGKTNVDASLARGEFTHCDGSYDEAETHEQVVALVQAGKLDATIWLDLDNTYALDDINAAFDSVRERKCIKAVVKLG